MTYTLATPNDSGLVSKSKRRPNRQFDKKEKLNGTFSIQSKSEVLLD